MDFLPTHTGGSSHLQDNGGVAPLGIPMTLFNIRYFLIGRDSAPVRKEDVTLSLTKEGRYGIGVARLPHDCVTRIGDQRP